MKTKDGIFYGCVYQSPVFKFRVRSTRLQPIKIDIFNNLCLLRQNALHGLTYLSAVRKSLRNTNES